MELDWPIERLLPNTAATLPATTGAAKLASLTVPVELPTVPAGAMTGAFDVEVDAGSEILLRPPVSMVTAPLCANARPSRVDPVSNEIDTAASMFP